MGHSGTWVSTLAALVEYLLTKFSTAQAQPTTAQQRNSSKASEVGCVWDLGHLCRRWEGYVPRTKHAFGSGSMRTFRLFPQRQLRCYAHGRGRARPSRLGQTVSLDQVSTSAPSRWLMLLLPLAHVGRTKTLMHCALCL